MVYCVLWQKGNLYQMFTNVIFPTEEEDAPFAKRSKLKKKHDCKIVKYDYKYFEGVETIEE